MFLSLFLPWWFSLGLRTAFPGESKATSASKTLLGYLDKQVSEQAQHKGELY